MTTNRNWKDYNKKLVLRGEFYINPRFLESWTEELKVLNDNKVGEPYLYPDSMFEFTSILYAKSFDYRSLEGILRALSKRTGNWPVPVYSQIRKRMLKQDLNIKHKGKDLVAGVDGTGFKVTNRGEWIREKWSVKRGWVKVTLLGNIDGNIVDVKIGSDESDERKHARQLIKKHCKKISLLSADGLHDTNETFNLLDKHNIIPSIKIRKNANPKGLGARPRAVREAQSMEHPDWVKKHLYGHRWVSTEGIFSAVKRIFGETLKSHKKTCLYREAKLKFWAYTKINSI